ncbi:MAG TPA: hypothetical protein G4N92_06645 [Anaerolineae bacterium]|nr:hypothetical protein [Anaerolineae bacterium]
MNEGILWFDDSKQVDLKHKIERAVAYFQQKYGYPPARCFIHPSMLSDKKIKNNGVEIRTSLYVLPYHFWLEFQNKFIRDN